MTIPPALWAVAALGTFAMVALVSQRRRQAAELAERRASWGRARERTRDMVAIGRYHRALIDADPSRGALDDRTWTDLDMDDVFTVLDRTESAVGQQVLYARLRTSPTGEHPQAFELLVARMSAEFTVREASQAALARLRDPAALDIVDLAAPGALQTMAWHIVFPLLGLTMIVALAILPFWPPILLLMVAGGVVNLALRTTVARSLQVVTGAFRQIGPLLAAAGSLSVLDTPDVAAILGRLRADTAVLSRLRRIASWAGRDSSGAAAGGIGGVVIEYLNLLFCLDANALFFGARELRAHAPELLRVIAAVGEVDAAISVASYRAGATGWTRPAPGAAGTPLRLVGIRHPLLPGAVPNSVTLGPPHGAIVTGSNMSGKSTFLRTVGVTVILAQTINTCLAEEYGGPALVVRSCIGRADDPSSGKSYYLVEVESVLGLVSAARTAVPHLMLFDELFRGTNAVERIAAGEAVLAALLGPGSDGRPTANVVIAATHDQELVDLLAGSYASYHFTDRMDADGLTFDYSLMAGPATTRNAIALLGLRGAPPELVAQALARARSLDQSRSGLRV